jgi:hypothetical protein
MYFPMAFSSAPGLDIEQTREQSHGDTVSATEFSQGSDIDASNRTGHDAEISGPVSCDSCSNFDVGQVSGNLGCDGVGGGHNEDRNNGDRTPWDVYKHGFCMIPFRDSSG